MENASPSNNDLLEILTEITSAGAGRAASGLTEMVGQSITVKCHNVSLISLLQLPQMLGGLENEAIGIYLRVEGGMNGQMMIIMSYQCALELADLLLETPVGTTRQLDRIERSALAEAGNLLGSFFLNTFYHFTGHETRPTPPTVIVDMLGAILDIVVASTVSIREDAILLRSTFVNGDRSLEASLWAIPEPGALERLYHHFKESDGRLP